MSGRRDAYLYLDAQHDQVAPETEKGRRPAGPGRVACWSVKAYSRLSKSGPGTP